MGEWEEAELCAPHDAREAVLARDADVFVTDASGRSGESM
jgi:hypothetical protein